MERYLESNWILKITRVLHTIQYTLFARSPFIILNTLLSCIILNTQFFSNPPIDKIICIVNIAFTFISQLFLLQIEILFMLAIFVF